MSKKCNECGEIKLREEFYKNNSGRNKAKWDCRDALCKPCRSRYATDRRKRIKEQAIKHLGGKCVDCGIVDEPCVYDFHHLNPTQKDFSLGANTKAFDSIIDELEKCVLLCSNCHRKRHYSLGA